MSRDKEFVHRPLRCLTLRLLRAPAAVMLHQVPAAAARRPPPLLQARG